MPGPHGSRRSPRDHLAMEVRYGMRKPRGARWVHIEANESHGHTPA